MPPGRDVGPRGDGTHQRHAQVPRDALREVLDERGPRRRPHHHDALGPLLRLPGVERREHGVAQRDGQAGVGIRVPAEQVAQQPAPADGVEAGDRAPRLGALVLRDPAAQVQSQGRHPGRPLAPGLDRHARGGQQRLGACDVLGVRRGTDRPARAPVAPAAAPRGTLRAGELGVVERTPQVRHPAAVGGHVVDHRLLLGPPGGGHAVVPLGVVRPGLARGGPPARDPADRAVHVEHLEHLLEPRPAQRDVGLQRGGGQGAPVRQRAQRGTHVRLRRERGGREPLPDRAVLAPGQQHRRGPPARGLGGAPGASDLLVVRDGRGRGAHVHDEAEVGLVEAHAQGGRRHQRLDAVAEQVRLGDLPLGRVGLAGVGAHVEPRAAQVLGDLVGRRDRQAVHDAGPLEGGQVLREPRQLRRRVGQPDDGEVEAGPVERAAQHQHVVARRGAELLGDVGGDPGVRRGGGRQHRDAVGQLGQQRADPAVVRAEVVPPVGDAVRLVDHDQAGVGREPGEHLVPEGGVREPLRRHEQDVDLARGDAGVHLVPLGDVRGVERRGADAGALGGGHLVAHEGEQRGHQHGRPRTPGAQQRGGDEVHGGLAPPGALHHQRPPVPGDERVDRAPLVVAQPRVVPPDQAAQHRLGLVAQLGPGPARGLVRRHRPRP